MSRGYVCANCGHGYNWHADYDDYTGRYVKHACDYWDGCCCATFIEQIVSTLTPGGEQKE